MQLSKSIRTDFGYILLRGYANNIIGKEDTPEGERIFKKLLSLILQIEFGQDTEEISPYFIDKILPILAMKYMAHENLYSRVEIMQHLLKGSKEEIKYCYDTLVSFMNDFIALKGMIEPKDAIFRYFVYHLSNAIE